VSGGPSGPIEAQLRELLKEGVSAEKAVARVLGPYRSGKLSPAQWNALAVYSRPFILRDARRIARLLTRRIEDRAFGGGAGSAAREVLARLEFHMPDGSAVAWEDSTREHHELRCAWLRTYIGSLEEDLDRHERAAKLLADRGVERLGDIPGWEDLIGDETLPDEGGEDDPASGEVVT
jgi:hypothetical protein